MDEVRVMIAKREHTRVCSTPYKIGAIVHVHSDHSGDLIVRRARVIARTHTLSHRMRSLSIAALRSFFARRDAEKRAEITVESSVAKRRVTKDAGTQFALLMNLPAALCVAPARAQRNAMTKRARVAASNWPRLFRGASRSAQGRVLANAVARVRSAAGLRRTQGVGVSTTSFASHNRRANGAAAYLRLIGQMPVSAVPCDRNAGGVTQWDTASRREPSPGAT